MAPALDDDLGLAQHIEDLAVKKLLARLRVETLDETVGSWLATSSAKREPSLRSSVSP
jgi:hypothetical protein